MKIQVYFCRLLMKTWVNLRPVYRTSSGPLSATPKRGSISSRLQTYKHSHNALGSFFSSAMQFIFPKPLQLIEHFPRRIRTQVWQKPTDTYGSLPSSARPDDFSPRPFTGTSISISKEHCYCVISLTVGLILFSDGLLAQGLSVSSGGMHSFSFCPEANEDPAWTPQS